MLSLPNNVPPIIWCYQMTDSSILQEIFWCLKIMLIMQCAIWIQKNHDSQEKATKKKLGIINSYIVRSDWLNIEMGQDNSKNLSKMIVLWYLGYASFYSRFQYVRLCLIKWQFNDLIELSQPQKHFMYIYIHLCKCISYYMM